MQVTNHWYINRGMNPSPVGRSVIKTVAPFEPAWLELRREDGLPWIDIAFDEILSPAKALEIGYDIQAATDCPVHFMSLSATGVEFMVAGEFLLDEGESYRPGTLEEYGETLETIAAGWNLPQRVERDN